ncbi:putative proline-specific permease put4 [Cyphellophora attinorum]|uniref:Putative proline-specific permease put4 n=1 Tax=Cyphellophora attinorum TaxID=1664694 RepID=A0A0N1NW41_9EURO|nr:putative proline-specific permease put4 [Phialophora attinorum]KPI35340.1 putative proline-specific permease put4 [Phialophora attinorum]
MDDKCKVETSLGADEERCDTAQAQVEDLNGHLKRGLKERHLQFIAIGGTIGTGLFLGIGAALATSGPLSLLLGYSISSVAIWIMMQCLGEMTTLLPLPGMIAQLGSRFIDPALGFAIGWNQFYNCGIAVCSELSAITVLVQYWVDVNPAIWITAILVLVVFFNIFAINIYGEAEFVFASIKILAIVGLLILAVVIDLGGAPVQGRLGFRYWVHPGPMNAYIAQGAAGRFLGLFATLTNAAFAFGGIEQIAVAAGETKNPTQNIPKAVRRVIWRLILFYVGGALAIGVLVPSKNPGLLYGKGVAKSPYLIAIQNAGIPVLPSILNAVIISSAASSANANLYGGSRYLYALAVQGQAPRILRRCTARGIPIYCVACTSAFGLLTYITISSTGSTVFHWFSTLNTVAYLNTWLAICYAYTRFRRALLHAGIDRNGLAFKAKGQPYLAWAAAVFFAIVLFFNGFAVFTHGHWDIQQFCSDYIGIPIFIGLYLFWKFVKKTKVVPIEEIDLYTGRVSESEMEQRVYARSCWGQLQKGWDKVL